MIKDTLIIEYPSMTKLKFTCKIKNLGIIFIEEKGNEEFFSPE